MFCVHLLHVFIKLLTEGAIKYIFSCVLHGKVPPAEYQSIIFALSHIVLKGTWHHRNMKCCRHIIFGANCVSFFTPFYYIPFSLRTAKRNKIYLMHLFLPSIAYKSIFFSIFTHTYCKFVVLCVLCFYPEFSELSRTQNSNCLFNMI